MLCYSCFRFYIYHVTYLIVDQFKEQVISSVTIIKILLFPYRFLIIFLPFSDNHASGWPKRQGKLLSRKLSSGAESLTPSVSSNEVFSSPVILMTPVGTKLLVSFSAIIMFKGSVTMATPSGILKIFLIRSIPK